MSMTILSCNPRGGVTSADHDVRMIGSHRQDIIHVDSGNNFIRARGGDDHIYGGKDVDVINGGNGCDYIRGGAGADYLSGDRDDDIIYGDDDDDVITDLHGDNHIFGGRGDDFIEATGTLCGGRDNDHITGLRHAQGNTYLFYPGDGQDTIRTQGRLNTPGGGTASISGQRGREVLQFGRGIATSDVCVDRVGEDLRFSIGKADQVTIAGWFSGAAYQLDEIRFDNRRALSADAIETGLAAGQTCVNQLIEHMAMTASPPTSSTHPDTTPLIGCRTSPDGMMASSYVISSSHAG